MSQIIRKAHAMIGYAAAEEDREILLNNFVDVDSYEIATDFNSPKFLLVGRTGTGKSAILERIRSDNQEVIVIDPKEFSLQYISNSNLISLYEKLDINLDLFYEFLWRHIFSVELLKHRFSLNDEKSTQNFISQILNQISAKRRKAFDYLQKYGDDFWLDIDSRTFEIMQRVENNFEAEMGIKVDALNAKIGGSGAEIAEIRSSYAHRAQKVLDSLRIQELTEVINWLADEIFDDPKRKYYLIIDDLDAKFASDRIRFSLIKSLIETIKKFRRVRNVRIVAAIRTDLLEAVFAHSKGGAFQEEKFEDNINLTAWNRASLKLLAEKRINYLFHHQYKKYNVSFDDIFKSDVSGENAFSYLVSRTLLRPRDLIAFTNECLEQAINRISVNAAAIRSAESIYSTKRFRALRDEWNLQYPLLHLYASFLDGGPSKFPFGVIDHNVLQDVMLGIAAHEDAEKDELGKLALRLGSTEGPSLKQFALALFSALFSVGIIFIKPHANKEFKSTITGKAVLNPADIDSDTMIYVHPMLWQHFNIRAES